MTPPKIAYFLILLFVGCENHLVVNDLNNEIPFLQIETGDYHTLVLKPDNSLWVCGDGSNGKLGDGLYDSYNKLFKIADNVISLSGGTDYTRSIRKDNTLWGC